MLRQNSPSLFGGRLDGARSIADARSRSVNARRILRHLISAAAEQATTPKTAQVAGMAADRWSAARRKARKDLLPQPK